MHSSQMSSILYNCCGHLCPHQPSSSTTQVLLLMIPFMTSCSLWLLISHMLLVLGHFNAQVGSDLQSWGSVVGPHDMGDCNSNGQRLLDFCTDDQLLVTDNWFRHKPIHKATWYHSRTGHIIDCFGEQTLSWFRS